MEPTKRMGVEISEELHREVKAVAARQGLKFRDATREAYLMWLKEIEGGKATVVRSPYRRTAEFHELLEYVLENDKKAAESIKTSLRLIAEAIEARQKPTRARRARGA